MGFIERIYVECMIIDTMFSSKTDLWATPQEFFDELDAEFHFTLDPCATPENAKCKKFYTRQENGLQKNWGGDCVLQSAVRPGDLQMGQKMLRRIKETRNYGRTTYSRTYRHSVFP